MNFYNFQLKLLNGETLHFSEFKEHPVLIVNTATHCGFTPQYKALETIWKTYKDQGLRILAIPSNDFGQQTPGSAKDIEQFCTTKFHVTFPQTQCYKVSGDDAIPLFHWLTSQFPFWAKPKWNFYKYFVDKHGKAIAWYPSIISPNSWFIRRKIQQICH